MEEILVLKITTKEWVGNFERELIAYITGVLDNVQLDINYEDYKVISKYKRKSFSKLFWKEEFNTDLEAYELFNGYSYSGQDVEKKEFVEYIKLDNLPKEYDLYTTYLRQIWDDCDDWEQWSFYNTVFNKDGTSTVSMLLNKELSDKWYEIITRRVKQFCEKAYIENDGRENINLVSIEYGYYKYEEKQDEDEYTKLLDK